MNKDDVDRLISNVIFQAKYFLENAGEFYPFGALMNTDDSIKPIGAYLEGDGHPASLDVFDFLENAINGKIQNGDCTCAAIGMDVLITLRGRGNIKKDALRVTVLTQENVAIHYYYLYERNLKNEYVFEKYTGID